MGPVPGIRAVSGGVALDLEVTPDAAQDRFPAESNPWRGTIGARVRARAENGQANEAVITLIARFFGVGRGDVSIVRGARSRRKTIRLSGVTLADAAARLARRDR